MIYKIYKILNRYTQAVIFEGEAESLKALVERAVREGVSLNHASLNHASCKKSSNTQGGCCDMSAGQITLISFAPSLLFVAWRFFVGYLRNEAI